MSSLPKNRILFKIFIGFPLSTELKIQLNQAKGWKQASIVKEKDCLSIVRYRDCEYLGQYFRHSMLTMKEVKAKAQEIGKLLHQFLPERDTDALQVSVFSQIFVS